MRSWAEPAERPHADPQALESAILESHAAGDLAGLAALFAEAGARAATRGEVDPACFFWTQAWIYALDAGDEALARDLEWRLRVAGRLDPRPGVADERSSVSSNR